MKLFTRICKDGRICLNTNLYVQPFDDDPLRKKILILTFLEDTRYYNTSLSRLQERSRLYVFKTKIQHKTSSYSTPVVFPCRHR
jgi:hypothetical protein